MKKKLSIFVLMTSMLLMIAGCATTTGPQAAGTPAPNGQINVPAMSIQINAPSQNPLINTAGTSGHVAGIVLGIWHGVISPVTLVLSFINKDGQMYEVHNDGSPYNLGFLLGVAIVFVILGALLGSRRR